MALMMLLQRSPIQWIVAEFRFSLGSRMVHLLKWVAGAGMTSAFYNTVTGATGDLRRTGNIAAVEGSLMQVGVQAEDVIPQNASIEGDLPPGIASNLGEGGSIPSPGVITFSGIATTAGEYPVTVTITKWEDDSPYEGDPKFIRINFEVTLEPPEITKDPQTVQVPLRGTAELTVEVDDPENTTFQWQKSTDLNNYNNIEGAVEAVYRAENATPELNGAYRVRVTKNGLSEFSDPPAFITVSQEENFDSWQFEKFGDDSNTEDAQPESNPDKDAFLNAFEFLFDLDPQVPDSIQSPIVSQEVIDGEDYAVFTFPALIDFPNLVYSFERTDDLQKGPWIQLLHAVEDVLIETDENGTVLKIPSEDVVFIRLKVDTD